MHTGLEIQQIQVQYECKYNSSTNTKSPDNWIYLRCGSPPRSDLVSRADDDSSVKIRDYSFYLEVSFCQCVLSPCFISGF